MNISQLIIHTRHLFLLAALVAAIWFWKYYKNTSERYFLYYLIYSVLNEFLGFYFKRLFGIDNYIIYNIYMVVSFLFYLYWFQQILKNKILVYILVGFFTVCALYSSITEKMFEKLFRYAFIAGIICIISLTIYYFVKALQSEKITFFLKDSKFWIVTGLFLFHLGFLPILLLHDKLIITNTTYFLVMTALNVVLYSCYIKAFICTKEKI